MRECSCGSPDCGTCNDNAEIRGIITELELKLKEYKRTNKNHKNKNTQLVKNCNLLSEALGFYGDKNSWVTVDGNGIYKSKGKGIWYFDRQSPMLMCDEGEIAREAILKTKEAL